jgi:uncharacterized delta-60 repeat protein
MKKYYFALVYFLVALGHAQNPAARDPGFNPFSMPLNQFANEGVITKISAQTDGKLLMLNYKSIFRRDANQLDTGFNVTFSNNPQLSDFLIQPDGKIIVTGNFTTVNGIAKKQMVRLNADGSLDNSFAVTGTGFSYVPQKIQLLPDGKILVSGNFYAYNEIAAKGMIRLNPNGTRDNTFTSAVDLSNINGKAFLQPDNKILLALASSGTGSLNLLRRLNSDGSIDTAFTDGQLGTGNILNTATQSDGKIIVTGTFSTYNSAPSNSIVRINADGTTETTFPVGFGSASPASIVIQPDAKIVIGGYFYTFNGSACKALVRLNPDCSRDTTFDTSNAVDLAVSNQSYVNSMVLQADGKLIIAGSISYYGNYPVNHILRVNTDGSRDAGYTNLTKAFDATVNVVALQPDGKILVSGVFGRYNGDPAKQLIRLNADGSRDSSFALAGTGFTYDQPYWNSSVKAIAVQTDGKIVLGGEFTTFNGQTVSRIMRLNSNGSRDTSFLGTGFNDTVNEIVLQPDGKIIVRGIFSTYNGIACEKIVRLNANGARDTSFTSALNTIAAYDVALQSDGKILAGGNFSTTINSVLVKTMIRLNANGTHDTSFTFGPTADAINKLAVQADGKIVVLIAGMTGNTSEHLERLNANGTLDTGFSYPTPGPTHVAYDFTMLPDGKVLLVSYNSNATTIHKLERLNTNGSTDPAFDSGVGFTGQIYRTLIQPDGKILLGGGFTTYKNIPENRILRLSGEEYYFISGNNKLDANNNGCDSGDGNFANLNFQVTSNTTNTAYIANTSGIFNLGLPAGNYTLTPVFENPAYFGVSPASITLNFPAQTSPVSQNFCISPTGNHADLEISILPINVARPGFDSHYKMVYKNKGNQTQSGTIRLDFNDAATDMTVANPVIATQLPNVLTWNFTNLLPMESREISFTLNLNSPTETPALNSGDLLSFTANVLSTLTDDTPADNTATLAQTVVNSFDPNDKTCLEGAFIDANKVGEYVHYMIRFENTGTYPAQNISVVDMIDTSKYDVSSLVPVKGSHLFTTKISDGNKVEFYFKDINLPYADATNDGYVAFKIKTKSTLEPGDIFSNAAAIFFDYNSAITTDAASTTVSFLATRDFETNPFFTIYPNPAKGELHIGKTQTVEIKSIAIYNALGQLVLAIPNAQKVMDVDVSSLKSGNYFISINSDKGISNEKFIKL